MTTQRLLILFCVSTVFKASARDYSDLFPTPRGLSMGGALVSSVDDRSSLSYNPAGLALIEEPELRLPDLVLAQFSPDILDIVDRVKSIDTSGGGSSAVNALRDFDGVSASFGIDLLGFGWFRKQMAISLQLLSMNAAIRARTPSLFFAKMNARVTADSGLNFGYAQPFFNNHVRVGFVIRPLLLRGGFDETLENTEIANLSNLSSQLGFGWGYDGDVGLQANTPVFSVFGFQMKVLGGAVLQNIKGEAFHREIKSGLSTHVPPLERRGQVGIGFQLAESASVVPTLNIDFRDLGVKTDAWNEHLCIGAEFVLKPRSWFRSIIRAHYARGNWGGGIAGRLGFGELEIGTYAVNLGRGPGVGVNRRSYASLSARW